jgi:2-C-methyl-D-erythritol 4-phosphate cytidylyltransferase/2-C-methyl-D-erythritol 2,4-cyclodiphosphate synthase
MSKISVIIPAGGVGRRMGEGRPKQFLELSGLPVLIRTIRIFRQIAEVTAIVVVAPAAYLEETRSLINRYFPTDAVLLTVGGESRQQSVRAGLAVLPRQTELVAVHDGVRPLLTPELFRACVAGASETGAALLAVPVKDTVKAVDGQRMVLRTVERDELWLAQTPQVARRELLEQAFAAAARDNFSGTDEAALLERIGCRVKVVPGSERNLKITRPEDLLLAEALLGEPKRGEMRTARVGHGYDAHQLGGDRRLVLGGVEIPFDRGLVGHSDADVLLHALCDAMLGAAGLGDIGRHFPDHDPELKDISSLLLLERVVDLLSRHGLRLSNADVTVIAQRPKLSPYFPQMQAAIGRVCEISPERINVKATTTEKMGFAGREEGMAAHAVALLESALI